MKLWFRKYLFSSVGLIILSFSIWFFIPAETLISTGEKWKGVCWVGSRQPLQGGEIQALVNTGANAISQTPFGWQSQKNTPEIRWDMSN